MIEIDYNPKNVLKTLERLVKTCAAPHGIMQVVAGTMQSAVEQNFDDGGRPKWQPLKSGRVGQILQNTGNLRNSIQAVSDKDTAQVGTNVAYAAIHQFGGQTKPHKILPKAPKKALMFGGRVYKSVSHPGSLIPPRPFLRLTPQDENDIVTDVKDYLSALIK